MQQGAHSLGDLTRTGVLALLGRFGPLSRATLAQELGVSPATVTTVTRRLVEDGLVKELERGELERGTSTRGRPERLLRLVRDAGAALGVKVADDHVAGVRVGLGGQVMEPPFEEPFDARAPGAVDQLSEILRARLGELDRTAGLLGVGVGVPGIADVAGEGTVQSPILGWAGVPLAPQLQRVLGLPVLVDNDANTVAVFERLYGRGRAFSDFLVVTIGRGVGLGVVTDGALYHGAGGAAGEFGHIPLDPTGPRCACGNHGCLEAYVGAASLLAAAREQGLVGAHDGPDRLVELANAGNGAAREIFATAGRRLGGAVAGLVNVLNPARVLIAGERAQAWRYWLEGFEPMFRAHLFPPLRWSVSCDFQQWDDSAWAQGAAALVLAAPFAGPLDGRQPVEHVRARFAEMTGTAAPPGAAKSGEGHA